ncbi:MAG: transcription termination/antitermination protein NusA, partial [Bosea sp. 12-68-7]
AEFDEKRRALGVEDALREVPGITTAMMVALGENDVKNVEDLAGCATDDLVGWTERKDGETTRHSGYLDGFDLSRQDAEAIVMSARVQAGWVEAPADDAEPAAEETAEA